MSASRAVTREAHEAANRELLHAILAGNRGAYDAAKVEAAVLAFWEQSKRVEPDALKRRYYVLTEKPAGILAWIDDGAPKGKLQGYVRESNASKAMRARRDFLKASAATVRQARDPSTPLDIREACVIEAWRICAGDSGAGPIHGAAMFLEACGVALTRFMEDQPRSCGQLDSYVATESGQAKGQS